MDDAPRVASFGVAEVRRAVDDRELGVHFQPQVDLRTGELAGFEALTRWDHPTVGLISPAHFLAVAEHEGFISDVDHLALNGACHALARWGRRRPDGRLTVSSNISAHYLVQPRLLTDLAEVLERTRVTPGDLCLEITESALMEPTEVARAVRELKVLGVTVAIDDFGTGYSSLSRLRNLPVDIVKIDRSFVAGVAHDSGDKAIVAAVVDLATSLGLQVIAEGIETTEQLRELTASGCHHGQGFLWSPAVTVERADDLVARTVPFRFAVPVGPGEHAASPQPRRAPQALGPARRNEGSDLLALRVARPVELMRSYSALLRDQATATARSREDASPGSDHAGSEPASVHPIAATLDALDRELDAVAATLAAIGHTGELARSDRPGACDHTMLRWEHGEQIVTAIADFVATGVELGEQVLLIVTNEHRQAVLSELDARHVSLPAGEHLIIDAREALAELSVDGLIDRGRFARTMGVHVRRLVEDGAPLRVYGEAVDVLWRRNDPSGALLLESLWNELVQITPFTVLCGFHVSGDHERRMLEPVGALHTAVLG